MNAFSRRTLLAMGTASLSLGALRHTPSFAQNARSLPARSRYLVKNATVVSVDPALGTFSNGDIRIENGVIRAVGKNLPAEGAEIIDASNMIALPGFVDTHWHMWSSIARNFVADGRSYYQAKAATSQRYTAQDFYNSDMLGFAEAIHAGITTIHNYSHNTVSPAYADAELRAFADSGVRGLYTYGNPDGPPKDNMIDFADIDRLRRTVFANGAGLDGLVTLGVNLLGPVNSSIEKFEAEMQEARKREMLVALHAGQSPRSTLSAVSLRDKGWLDRNMLLTHFLLAKAEDRQAMAESGASLSLSPHSELRLGVAGDLRNQFVEMHAAGVNIALSCDANSVGPVNMFEAMRLMWNIGVPWLGTPTEKLPSVTYRQVIAMATINGARALNLDSVAGSLTPGKRADILLVRNDDINMTPAFEPEAALVTSATPENIDTVFIDGRIMKRRGKVTALDTAEIRRAAEESARAVRERAGEALTPTFR